MGVVARRNQTRSSFFILSDALELWVPACPASKVRQVGLESDLPILESGDLGIGDRVPQPYEMVLNLFLELLRQDEG